MTPLLQDYLARAVEATPGATAVVMGADRLSYAILEGRSNQLARLLVEQGCAPGDRVALCVPKSPAAIVSMLAILKAGAAYVPLDTDSAAARVARMVRATEPRALVAAPAASGFLDSLAAEVELPALLSAEPEPLGGGRLKTVATATDAAGLPAGALPRTAPPDGLAHLLFTSGSTGEPKGVMITHANVATFVNWGVDYFGIRAGDRNSGQPPLHFDLSTFDVYGTLAAGAELHLIPPEVSVDPRALAQLMRDSGLTQWFSVPSVLTYMARFDTVGEGDFPALERLLWCGEVLPTPILIHWMERLPHVRFTNLYGPTETTIASSFHTVSAPPSDPEADIPIGTACQGEELLVLDEDMRPVSPGEAGDLYVGGVGLSPGYWRDKERTRAAFLEGPHGEPSRRLYRTGDLARIGDDGLLRFLGRKDSQIKSRGFRIELGEVEAALSTVEGIRECAVVGVETGGFEGTAIGAAYSTAEGTELEPPSVRAALAELLPRYMLPTRWDRMEVLPKNANGKIDRPVLRERLTP